MGTCCHCRSRNYKIIMLHLILRGVLVIDGWVLSCYLWIWSQLVLFLPSSISSISGKYLSSAIDLRMCGSNLSSMCSSRGTLFRIDYGRTLSSRYPHVLVLVLGHRAVAPSRLFWTVTKPCLLVKVWLVTLSPLKSWGLFRIMMHRGTFSMSWLERLPVAPWRHGKIAAVMHLRGLFITKADLALPSGKIPRVLLFESIITC